MYYEIHIGENFMVKVYIETGKKIQLYRMIQSKLSIVNIKTDTITNIKQSLIIQNLFM